MYIKTNYVDIPEVLAKVNITNYKLPPPNVPFSKVELLNLAGGIPDENFDHFNFGIDEVSPQVLELRVDSSYHILTRTVDLIEMEINNDSFIVNEELRGRGLGTKILLNQIREARRLNFSKLIIYAIGGHEYAEDFNGYAHWAKYGYEMFPYDQARFEREWSRFGLATLRELAQNPGYYKIWELQGFSWSGMFKLNDPITLSFLKEYIQSQIEKGFNYELWPEVFE